MPAALLDRFGAEAERDLLLALRRGARAWEPVAALLSQQIPDSLPLDDDLLADLILDGASGLRVPASPSSGQVSSSPAG